MKKSKKFVLAALALLAITGLLPLAGCKNDSVPEPTRYTVKFDKNAEDASGEMQSQSFTEGVEQELSVNQFKRDTYTFSGWSEDKAATAPTYKDKAKFKATKDTTLYAVWTDNGTVTSVNFSPAGGTTLYYGDTVTLSTTTDGATIQYKLDDGEWMDYTVETPISVTTSTTSTTITARATKDGLKPSTETTATYTVRKLEGITVTSPERTVYSERQSFDSTGMVVTATYDDKSQREVTGWETDFNTVADKKGLGKPVTVSYKEGDTRKEASFTVDVASYQFTETVQDVDPSYTGTRTDGTYKKFGDWPQTIMDKDVTVGKNTMTRGGMDFHVGSDGNYYVKVTAKPYEDPSEYTYTYSDGKSVEKDEEVYFKVEPIKWRVLNKDYASTGKVLLLAESILTGGIPYYVDTSTRPITGAGTKEGYPDTVYPNNWQYSTVRAWLNGRYESDDPQDKEYAGKGFLQTAFTQFARELIAGTTVDNSAASTNPASNSEEWNDGKNEYASDTPTTDKIFLLSQQEATTSEYDFGPYSWKDSTRIRVTTDYAKATGAGQGFSEGDGGVWWLRSPYCNNEVPAWFILINGGAIDSLDVNVTYGGVVPALSISLQ